MVRCNCKTDCTVWPPHGAMAVCHSSNRQNTRETSSMSAVTYIINLAACASSDARRFGMTATLLFFVILYKPCCRHLQHSLRSVRSVGCRAWHHNGPVEPVVLAAGDEAGVQQFDGVANRVLFFGADRQCKDSEALERA